MKKTILTIAIFLALLSIVFASPKKEEPIYRLAFYAIDGRQASLDYLQQIRSHLIETRKAEAAIQEKWELGFSPAFLESGTPDEKTKLWLKSQFGVDKIVIIKTLGAALQISSLDVRKETLEYQNQLPESLAKTLLYDFFAYLERRNLYLAISSFPSSVESPVVVTSFQEKYRSGQNLNFDLEAKEDNYIYVVSIQENDSSAEPKLIFPNTVQPKNYLRKGEKIFIPGNKIELPISSQPGREKLRIFASKVPWNQMDWKKTDGRGFYRLNPPVLGSVKSSQTVASTSFLLPETQMTELYFEVAEPSPGSDL